MAARGALSGLHCCATLVPLFCRVAADALPGLQKLGRSRMPARSALSGLRCCATLVPLSCRVAADALPGLQRLPAIWRSIRALRRPAQAYGLHPKSWTPN